MNRCLHKQTIHVYVCICMYMYVYIYICMCVYPHDNLATIHNDMLIAETINNTKEDDLTVVITES